MKADRCARMRIARNWRQMSARASERGARTLFVRALEFAPDGRHLASASDDGTILTWDLQAAMSVGLDEPK